MNKFDEEKYDFCLFMRDAGAKWSDIAKMYRKEFNHGLCAATLITYFSNFKRGNR